MNLTFILIFAGILQFIGTMIFFARHAQLSNEVQELKLDLQNIRDWLKIPARNGGH